MTVASAICGHGDHVSWTTATERYSFYEALLTYLSLKVKRLTTNFCGISS